MAEQVGRERLTISGRLDAAVFVPWILRHADRLGLSSRIGRADGARIEIDVAGPLDLIDMMEVGCSLGPIEVWVETIRRRPIEDASRQDASPNAIGVA